MAFNKTRGFRFRIANPKTFVPLSVYKFNNFLQVRKIRHKKKTKTQKKGTVKTQMKKERSKKKEKKQKKTKEAKKIQEKINEKRKTGK